MTIHKRKTRKAIWTRAYPKQAKALHPETATLKATEDTKKAVYRAIEVEFMANHQACEVCPKIWSCEEIKEDGVAFWHEATEPHHVRGRQGLLLFDVRYWLATCSKAHRWIHDNPEAARKLGLLADKGDWHKID